MSKKHFQQQKLNNSIRSLQLFVNDCYWESIRLDWHDRSCDEQVKDESPDVNGKENQVRIFNLYLHNVSPVGSDGSDGCVGWSSVIVCLANDMLIHNDDEDERWTCVQFCSLKSGWLLMTEMEQTGNRYDADVVYCLYIVIDWHDQFFCHPLHVTHADVPNTSIPIKFSRSFS